MTSLFRTFLFALLGLAFAVFGTAHAVGSYPSSEAFSRSAEAMPAVGAVLSFGLGVAAAVGGLLFLVPSVYRLRRRRPRQTAAPVGRAANGERPRPASVRQDADFETGHDDCGGEYDPEHVNGGYRDDYGRRPQGNGQLDDRRWAGSYR